MKKLLTLSVIVLCALSSCKKSDEELLQGEWQLTEATSGGNSFMDVMGEDVMWRFNNNVWEWKDSSEFVPYASYNLVGDTITAAYLSDETKTFKCAILNIDKNNVEFFIPQHFNAPLFGMNATYYFDRK